MPTSVKVIGILGLVGIAVDLFTLRVTPEGQPALTWILYALRLVFDLGLIVGIYFGRKRVWLVLVVGFAIGALLRLLLLINALSGVAQPSEPQWGIRLVLVNLFLGLVVLSLLMSKTVATYFRRDEAGSPVH